MYKADQNTIDLFNKNYRQVIRITFRGKYEEFIITENRIIQGGLTIDRYSVSGSKIEIASAVAAELNMKLKNDDGRYDDTVFEGAELFVEVGIKKWDAHRWERAEIIYIPCGYFIVDTPPRALSTISVSALDRMVLFDKEVDWSRFTFPVTVENFVDKICEVCGIECATTLSGLVNHNYIIPSAPDTEGLTYRQLIQWCAFLTATCAFIDHDGKLVFKWYEQTDYEVTPSERYASDMYENDITLTGLVYNGADSSTIVVGDTSYALQYDSCGLLQEEIRGALTNIYLAIRGFTYRPYEATIKSAPFLYPMDMIRYTDSKGVVHDTIVTHVTFTINRSTTIAGSGETTTSNEYASSSSGLTSQQNQAIQNIKNTIEVTFSDEQLSGLNVSQLLANMVGFNLTIITADDNSKTYYVHNGNTLAGSTSIYTLRNGHFAYTSDWNNGNPHWTTEILQSNVAIHKVLSRYKLTGGQIADNSITENHLATDYVNKVELEIGQTLVSAKSYTDTQLDDAKDYVDSEISDTHDYIDSEISDVRSLIDTREDSIKAYSDENDAEVILEIKDILNSYAKSSEVTAAISEAVKDFMYSADIQALSRYLFIEGEDGTEYKGKLKVVNGKPVFEYDTTEGGME